MLDWLSDPKWQGIGGIVAILSLAIVLIQIQSQRKKIQPPQHISPLSPTNNLSPKTQPNIFVLVAFVLVFIFTAITVFGYLTTTSVGARNGSELMLLCLVPLLIALGIGLVASTKQ